MRDTVYDNGCLLVFDEIVVNDVDVQYKFVKTRLIPSKMFD